MEYDLIQYKDGMTRIAYEVLKRHGYDKHPNAMMWVISPQTYNIQIPIDDKNGVEIHTTDDERALLKGLHTSMIEALKPKPTGNVLHYSTPSSRQKR